MKAIRIHAYGASEQMQVEDIATPTIGANQVLVRMNAAGVNPVDWKIRSGMLAQMMPITLPFTPGWDGAGDVVAVGSEVKNFRVGDAVYFLADFAHGGTYAEYVAVDAAQVAIKPRTLSYTSAAALAMPGLAAWTALKEFGRIQSGMRILIHGGAGAVGSVAIQLAKQNGLYVITTASGAGIAFVKSLGADEVIDYRTQRFEELVRDVDVVLDSIGGPVQDASWGTLKAGGILLALATPPNPEKAKAAGVNATFVFTQPNGQLLAKLTELVDQGGLNVGAVKELTLADAAEAHRLGESGQAGGKMVLRLS